MISNHLSYWDVTELHCIFFIRYKVIFDLCVFSFLVKFGDFGVVNNQHVITLRPDGIIRMRYNSRTFTRLLNHAASFADAASQCIKTSL